MWKNRGNNFLTTIVVTDIFSRYRREEKREQHGITSNAFRFKSAQKEAPFSEIEHAILGVVFGGNFESLSENVADFASFVATNICAALFNFV